MGPVSKVVQTVFLQWAFRDSELGAHTRGPWDLI